MDIWNTSTFATMNNAAVNIHMQVCVWIYAFHSLGDIPRNGIAGLYGNSGLKLLRNCKTVFQSGCIT